MSKLTRRHFIGTAGVGAAAAMTSSMPVFAQAKRVTIGTNPAGSLYFSIGGGLAKVITEKMGVQAIVQPFTGSSVALPLVNGGELTGSLASTLDSGFGFRGEGPWKGKPMKNLRSLVRILNLPYTFTVRADSGLKTIADLKGKRVVMDFKGQIALKAMNEALIQAGGLSLTDVQHITVAGLKPGLDAVADKSAEASAVAAGIAMVQEMHATTPVRYLNVTGPNATDEFMAKVLPGSSLMQLQPNPRMPEVTEPTTIGTYDVYLVVGSDMTDADATKMTTTLIETWADLQKDYAPLRGSKLQDLARPTATAPYHPGAVAAFKAKNLWSDAIEAHNKKIM